MDELLARARRDRARNETRPTVYGVTGWRSVLYYLYYRNRFFFLRESGMWLFNLLEIGLAAWLLGGMRVRGFALAGRYAQLLCALWGGVTFVERILVGRYHATGRPERIARTVATFIQLGAVAGLLLALLLNLLAPFLVAPSASEDVWTLLFFRHRAFLLVPELISGSLFTGAYTLARMYRPLSITFLVRLCVVLSNIFLFPVWGEPVLVVNLYLPRLMDLAVTAWVSRRWAFARHRVPPLPLRSLPSLNAGLVRELAPFAAGRCLGVLFSSGYSLIIIQTISWLLPQEMVFYVLFLQALALLYLIPRRLARSIFFDVSQLLIWNRLGVLKEYVRKLDRVAALAGLVTAGLCLLVGLLSDRLPWWLSPERAAQVRPLIYAMIPFLLFHPQNAIWQSVRDAAGELRFNNLLLLATHYLIALPINLWILTRVHGRLQVVQSHGLDFVVVTHALLFVRVLLVDGAMEGLRAFLSRAHILRFRWAEDSPLRVTRSLMDTELALAQGHATALSFSQDIADLWSDRFLRAREEGLVSLPFWGSTVARFLRNGALRARGIGLVRLSLDRRSQAVWKPGGGGFPKLLSLVRPIDSVCRVSPNRAVVFLPCVTVEELRRHVAEISASIGIHLLDLSCVHSASDRLETMAEVAHWVIAPDGDGAKAHGALSATAGDPDYAWQAASQLFPLRRGADETHQRMLRRLCVGWEEAEAKGVPADEFASTYWANLLRERLGAEVAWCRLDHWTARDHKTPGDIRFMHGIVHAMDTHRIPDFRRFLKTDASHLLPFFFRTHLVGMFVYPTLEHARQMNLVRMAAAFYLWATLRSIDTFRWEDTGGFAIAPVFQAELDAAKRLRRETGVPYAHLLFPRPRDAAARALWMTNARRAFGSDALISQRKRRLEILLPGTDPAYAVERIRYLATDGTRP